MQLIGWTKERTYISLIYFKYFHFKFLLITSSFHPQRIDHCHGVRRVGRGMGMVEGMMQLEGGREGLTGKLLPAPFHLMVGDKCNLKMSRESPNKVA